MMPDTRTRTIQRVVDCDRYLQARKGNYEQRRTRYREVATLLQSLSGGVTDEEVLSCFGHPGGKVGHPG